MLRYEEVPDVLEVEIRDRDIVDKKTGEVLVFKTNNATWRAISGNIASIVKAKANRGGVSYLISWRHTTDPSIPKGTLIGSVAADCSNRTHVLGEDGSELGLCYDLSYRENRLKFVHMSGAVAPF